MRGKLDYLHLHQPKSEHAHWTFFHTELHNINAHMANKQTNQQTYISNFWTAAIYQIPKTATSKNKFF
jgi:hypothetical protein